VRRDIWERHPACMCGCGELADECPRGSNPLGSMTIRPPEDPTRVHLLTADERGWDV